MPYVYASGSSGGGSGGAAVQSDWDQTDELSADYIKNKPDESDAIELIIETGLAEPLFEDDDTVLADEQSIFVL